VKSICVIAIAALLSAQAGFAAAAVDQRVTAPRVQPVNEVAPRAGIKAVRTRGGRIVYPEQVRAAIRDYVRKELAGRALDCQVTVGEPQEPFVVPSGTLDINVSAGGAEDLLGRRTFLLHVAVNRRIVRTIEATADVAAVLEVIVPVRLIKADEQIEADDVTTDNMVVFDLKQTVATDTAEVVGKAAVRPLAPQSPIRLTAVRRPFAVHKGDRVTIEARQGGLAIQTVGVTKSHGELGQTITVSNADSGKELRAKIIAPGVVRVDF
jgi:flagella basal body P-ring formation protein FlgA